MRAFTSGPWAALAWAVSLACGACAGSAAAAPSGKVSAAQSTAAGAERGQAVTAASEAAAPPDEFVTRARRELGGGPDARDMDGEVIAALDAVDRAQVELGMQSRSHAGDARVRALTARLMLERADSIARRERLAERLGVAPRESPASASLAADSNATLARLGRLRGAAWDRAYLGASAAQHARCLSLVDRVLSPVATAPALREELAVEVRPAVARDLARTEALRAELERP